VCVLQVLRESTKVAGSLAVRGLKAGWQLSPPLHPSPGTAAWRGAALHWGACLTAVNRGAWVLEGARTTTQHSARNAT